MPIPRPALPVAGRRADCSAVPLPSISASEIRATRAGERSRLQAGAAAGLLAESSTHGSTGSPSPSTIRVK